MIDIMTDIERQLYDAYKTDLKPCPFCGRKPKIEYLPEYNNQGERCVTKWWIVCWADEFWLSENANDFPDASCAFRKLVERWNTRIDSESKPYVNTV